MLNSAREEEGVWLDLYTHQPLPGLLELHLGDLKAGRRPLTPDVPDWKPPVFIPLRTSERQEMPLVGAFGCLELCLYGIRELA